jgi:hypothetical protein
MTCSDALPIGAGLCVRTNVAEAYAEHYRNAAVQLSDRRGASLLSGGDFEICYVACRLGLGMGLFPELKVIHLIPKERIDEQYLVKIAEGIHISLFLLKYKWLGVLPQSDNTIFRSLRIIRNICRFRGLRRRMYLAEVRAAKIANKIIGGRGTVATASPEIFENVSPSKRQQ